MIEEFFGSADTTAWLVIGTSAIIIVVVLFSKFLKFVLKLAIIAVMLLAIVYFLRQLGHVELPFFESLNAERVN